MLKIQLLKLLAKKHKNERIPDSVQTDAMKTIIQLIKTQRAHQQESKTQDDMFSKMILSELKKFPENLKFCLKHDINQVIYNYKLNQYMQYNDPSFVCNSNWFPLAVASSKSDSSQPLQSPLMKLSGKWFQPL